MFPAPVSQSFLTDYFIVYTTYIIQSTNVLVIKIKYIPNYKTVYNLFKFDMFNP